jgi:hypothetical protein
MPIYRELSTPLVELPTYLSTISMIVDDRAAIVRNLIQAERKSPPVYGPSRDLFLSVLQGKLSFEKAVIQARRLADQTERKCAAQIIDASEQFLRHERPTIAIELPNLKYALPNGLELKIAPVWVRHYDPDRLMILHFWQAPLFQRQLSAAASVLRAALHDTKPQYSACEIDFISVAFSRFGTGRRFERYNWNQLKPLDDAELSRFWQQFLAAWSHYQRVGPREIKRKRGLSLFDKWG